MCASVHMNTLLVTSKHVLHQVAEWAPEVLTTGETVLINEENIVLEACVEMRLEPKMNNHRVVVAVNVSIYPIEALEELTQK